MKSLPEIINDNEEFRMIDISVGKPDPSMQCHGCGTYEIALRVKVGNMSFHLCHDCKRYIVSCMAEETTRQQNELIEKQRKEIERQKKQIEHAKSKP